MSGALKNYLLRSVELMDKQEQILELASLKIFNLYMSIFSLVMIGIGVFFGALWWKQDFIGWLLVSIYCGFAGLIILGITVKVYNALNRTLKRVMAK